MDLTALDDDGLILTARVRDRIDDSVGLRKEVARGKLIALRRGAFVETERWVTLTSREQHLLRARAVIEASARPLILCGVSAAAAWGMPIEERWPTEVSVLDAWKGGGRSEPGVRSTSAGFATAHRVVISGLPTTDLARTALMVARTHSFVEAIGSLDWALWRKNPAAITKYALSEELARLAPRAGARHLARLLAFSTHLSDSFGESRCRAVIHLLGFAPPELQVEFRDSQGLMIPDFYWRSVRQAAEFDGKNKYTLNVFTAGDPTEVVWREKKREDRLRRLVGGVTRILTADTSDPQRLAGLLTAAGVPRGGDIPPRRG